ncbi:MAG: P1 family peptidase, partial [Woeseia sp.]
RAYAAMPGGPRELGSIIIVVATDAPLLPHQLKRVVKRAALGLARNGGIASNGSGDIFIAFSTANDSASQSGPIKQVSTISNENISPFFQATVEATEEAIINAMIAGRDMTGHRGHTVRAINHAELQRVLAEHNRLNPTSE